MNVIELKTEIESSIYDEGYFGLDGTKVKDNFYKFGRGVELNKFIDSLSDDEINELKEWLSEEDHNHYIHRGSLYGLEEYLNTDYQTKDGSMINGMLMELKDYVFQQHIDNFETKMREMGFKGYFDIEDKEEMKLKEVS